MVGIVVVSHSQKLAEGVVELASLMAPETPMKAAGGMDDGGFGTSFEKITEAIDEVYSCLLYTSPSPRDLSTSRMPSSA